MPNQLPYSILDPNADAFGLNQTDLVKQLLANTNAQGIIAPGNQLKEVTSKDNTYYLAAGQYPNFNNTATGFQVVGVAGSKVAQSLIQSFGTFTNVWFTGQTLLKVSSRATFNQCRFDIPVVMEAGSKASFQGCLFANNSNVQNAGAAGNCGILGCLRGTVAHVNATVIFEMTI